MAGVSAFGPLERSTYEDYDWMMGVNFGGVVNSIQTFVPRMIAHGQGGRQCAFLCGLSTLPALR
jgi:NADP-dependent 3-hydroxy acid dehydrogenase YdfG